MPFTARIERALFHRARSASKKGTRLLPSYPSEAARCASRGLPQPFTQFSASLYRQYDLAKKLPP